MKTLYLIDAVNFLFRSYYAIGPMTNQEGASTSALYGFIRSVQKLIKTHQIEHLCCVFDGPDNKKSRREIYTDYKANRQRAPEDLLSQFVWAEEFCTLSGISTLCINGVEADDTLASVALWAKSQSMKVRICSSDKDLMQLIDEDIQMLQPHKGDLLIDAAKVEELLGIRPNQVLDYLAIVGDASDNIPGLSGFGPKTAVALLHKKGTLDEVLKDPTCISGPKKQQILREEKEIALMSRKLATLHTTMDIPKEGTFYALNEPQIDALEVFYQKMNFRMLLKELEESKPLEEEALSYQCIETEEALISLLEALSKETSIALDTETTSLDPMQAKLVGIGLSTKPATGFYIPFNGVLPKKTLRHHLKPFFESLSRGFFGHNLKYDLHVLANEDLFVGKIDFDTLLASHLLHPETRRHNLDALSLEHFNKVKTPLTDLIGKGKNTRCMSEVPIDQVTTYCCEDVDFTVRLKNLFAVPLKEKGLDLLLLDLELPLLRILFKMEREGIYLNTQKLEGLRKELQERIKKEEEKVYLLAGDPFNLNSPKQLSEVLFEKLQLKPPGKKKTQYSTSADVLEELTLHHPIAKHLLTYRMLEKLRSTYVDALPLAVHPQTGRIHCSFSQSGTATGRLSCQNPNLQNIPIKTEEGKSLRTCFEAKPHYQFLSADYSQVELRLLAHFSQDEQLIRAFQENQDIHSATAALVLNIPEEMVTPEMRSQAKAVNFGILYGQGPLSLSKQLHIPLKEASLFIQRYFEQYPKVGAFFESCKQKARDLGYVETLLGRRRPIPEIHNPNPALKAAAERLSVNTPLQGTAADLIKKAMLLIESEINEKQLQAKVLLQIHDELLFEVPEEEIPLLQEIVLRLMKKALPLKVPLEVDIAVGKNWAAC